MERNKKGKIVIFIKKPSITDCMQPGEGKEERVFEEEEKAILRPGSFISFDANSKNPFYVFKNHLSPDIKGLCITRKHPSLIREEHPEEFEIEWLNQKNFKNDSDLLQHVEKKIKSFLKQNKFSIILLERTDYLINLFGFESFLKLVYSINEDIIEANSSLIIHSNPYILNEKEKQLLQLELSALPKPAFIEKIRLAKDLYDILELVKSSESKVSFKNICKKFNITKATARKRVYELYRRNLIIIKKDGRAKIVELTKESRSII